MYVQSPRDGHQEGADNKLGIDTLRGERMEDIAHVNRVAAEREGEDRRHEEQEGWNLLADAQHGRARVLDHRSGGRGAAARGQGGGPARSHTGDGCPVERAELAVGRERDAGEGGHGRGNEGHFGSFAVVRGGGAWW